VLAYALVQTYSISGWTALGDPTRRAIFERLAERPQAVNELADELPVRRPAVSQHLSVLKEAGLVEERRDGTRRLYRANPNGLVELRNYLDQFWGDRLAALKREAEREEEKRNGKHD